jgi:hypothetical protein
VRSHSNQAWIGNEATPDKLSLLINQSEYRQTVFYPDRPIKSYLMVLIQEKLEMGVYLLNNPEVDDLYDVIGIETRIAICP